MGKTSKGERGLPDRDAFVRMNFLHQAAHLTLSAALRKVRLSHEAVATRPCSLSLSLASALLERMATVFGLDFLFMGCTLARGVEVTCVVRAG